MPALPSGTVTYLFTDVEGSTRLLRRLGDAYAGVLSEHQHLLCAAFAHHSDRAVDTQGCPPLRGLPARGRYRGCCRRGAASPLLVPLAG